MFVPQATVVAEAGANHNDRMDLALAPVDAAKAARADAVSVALASRSGATPNLLSSFPTRLPPAIVNYSQLPILVVQRAT
jgi:hypothetical protein